MATIGLAMVKATGMVLGAVGVPGAGTVAGALQAVIELCVAVGENEGKCRAFQGRCQELLNVLESRKACGVSNAELTDAESQLELTLSTATLRMQGWAKSSWIRRLLQKREVEDSLRDWTNRINNTLELFKMYVDYNTLDGIEVIQDNNKRAEAKLDDVAANVKEIADLQKAMAAFVEKHVNIGVSMTHDGPVSINSSASSRSPLSRQRDYSTDVKDYQESGRRVAELIKKGIPTCMKTLDGQVHAVGPIPEAGGPFSDVWIGKWAGGQKVAIRALRGIGSQVRDKAQAKQIIQRFIEELNVWSKLSHPNILECYGVSVDAAPNCNLSVISPWQENGNVASYIAKHPDAPRLRLMKGAAAGLEYLHLNRIVHGNVRCANILVSAEMQARIFDFGVSKVMQDITQVSGVATMTTGGLKDARWLPPELLQPRDTDGPSTSFNTDVWSFSMAILECMTGHRPYNEVRKDPVFLYRICSARQLPDRPSDPPASSLMSDNLWNLLVECWQWEPTNRPSMAHVSQRMKEIEATSS